MAIDELTDEAFFEAYQKNPQIKNLVEGIQRKYNVHSSQTAKPDPKNVSAATKEAKDVVKKLLGQQKQDGKEKTTAASASGIFSGRMGYAAGLFGIVAIVAALSTFGATAPLTALSYGISSAYAILPLY